MSAGNNARNWVALGIQHSGWGEHCEVGNVSLFVGGVGKNEIKVSAPIVINGAVSPMALDSEIIIPEYY